MKKVIVIFMIEKILMIFKVKKRKILKKILRMKSANKIIKLKNIQILFITQIKKIKDNYNNNNYYKEINEKRKYTNNEKRILKLKVTTMKILITKKQNKRRWEWGLFR